ncbi:hypothetical protein PITCH_A1860006 [uncultured Desulfobacterium sp.]|uniref:Uncharacterized protein n=1 Tax=uncultured Desulfobacterium sp. TaxID=201089 RepID=A0A445MV98_9BACT|nr:hypothetical protein PITCH_A1860006 [uncultured Desulfobacterium sp.]
MSRHTRHDTDIKDYLNILTSKGGKGGRDSSPTFKVRTRERCLSVTNDYIEVNPV